jgi:putative transposase
MSIQDKVYRSLFQTELDNEAISDMRLALNQNQPLGNSSFYAKGETMIGQRREPKPRGRPRKKPDESPIKDGQQGELPI